jgi:Fe-S cluster biogenesis protein NfuA
VSCPISFITLKMGIEAQLKEKVPGVESVVSVDDE